MKELVEFACKLQRDCDEYNRFCMDLLVTLLDRDHRRFVKHGLEDGSDSFDAIWELVDEILKENAELREKNRVSY